MRYRRHAANLSQILVDSGNPARARAGILELYASMFPEAEERTGGELRRMIARHLISAAARERSRSNTAPCTGRSRRFVGIRARRWLRLRRRWRALQAIERRSSTRRERCRRERAQARRSAWRRSTQAAQVCCRSAKLGRQSSHALADRFWIAPAHCWRLLLGSDWAIVAYRDERTIHSTRVVRAAPRAGRDIRDHLPRFFEEARGTVLELGVRGGGQHVGLSGGIEQRGGEVWSVDVDPSCSETYAGHPLWHFVCADSRDPAPLAVAGLPSTIDVLFVDTLHEYAQVRDELAVWGPRVSQSGIVLFHDTDRFPEVAARGGGLRAPQGISFGIPARQQRSRCHLPGARSETAGAVTVVAMWVRRLSRRAAAAAREHRAAFVRRHPRCQRASSKTLGGALPTATRDSAGRPPGSCSSTLARTCSSPDARVARVRNPPEGLRK